MSVPPINPLPIVPTNTDPRFRYGFRAIPENFQQATSRFYLPQQRDSRFWPISYDASENDCLDSLSHKQPPVCKIDQDCQVLVNKWCTDGEARKVRSKCHRSHVGDKQGTCKYDFVF